MTTFFIIKHGDTCSQIAIDRPLSLKGLKQAKTVLSIIKNEEVKKIYSSPAMRTRQMVYPLSEYFKISTEIDQRLRDRKLSKNYLESYYQSVCESFKKPDYNYFGGESLVSAIRRVRNFMEEKITQHLNECVVISTHGVCTALILAQFAQKPAFLLWKRMKPGNIYRLSIVRSIYRYEQL